jgi:hypothetical protein
MTASPPEETPMTTLSTARRTVTLALAAALLAPGTAWSAQTSWDQADDLQLYPRDVYVIVGSTLRNPDATTPANAPLFNQAGAGLNVTWGQWGQVSATSAMRVSTAMFKGYKTDATISLKGLVPGGVYSVFYGTLYPDSENPLCPGVERTLPFPTTDTSTFHPDASSFVADSNGNATYAGSVSGNLFTAAQVYVTIVYHADRRTYHPLPNAGEYLTQGSACRSSFGQDAFRHLLILQKW